MNPKYQEILSLMKQYDNAQIGSKERAELGGLIDDHSIYFKEKKDITRLKINYEGK